MSRLGAPIEQVLAESTHFLSLRRDVGIFDSTKAPDGSWERRHVPPLYFLTIQNRQRQPYHAKTGKICPTPILIAGLLRPYLNICGNIRNLVLYMIVARYLVRF